MRTKIRLMAAMERLLESNSYEEITISMISKEAGIARQGFYKFYANKEDLIYQMFVYFADRGAMMDHEFTLREFITHDLSEVSRHTTFFKKMSLDSYDSKFFLIFYDNIYKIYHKMICYHLGQQMEERLRFILQAYCMGGSIQVLNLYKKGEPIDADYYTDVFIDMMPEEVRVILESGTYPPELLRDADSTSYEY